MFSMPQPTPYDLCFTLFGFPVRVHPMFWLAMVLFGPKQIDTPEDWARIGIWVGVAFVSILIHEFGHAVMFRHYRCHGTQIWLYWFGGLAGGTQRPHGHWPNIHISLAGPAAQLLFCGAVYLSNRVSPWAGESFYTVWLYIYLIMVNLYWALLNLLPVYPLDGGQVMRELCHLWRVPQPDQASLKISMATAIAVAALGLIGEFQPQLLSGLPWWFPVPSLFGVLLFASLAYASWEALEQYRGHRGGYA